jgi:UDP-2,3-diacylglucosamine pyrophosphatase LpxH
LDPWFTLRYCFLSGFYFLKTRFSARFRPGSRLRETVEIIKQEGQFFLDLEREARQFLTLKAKVKTLIVGHTHRPMNKIYSDGKQYINTGTWTRMINLDWRSIGRQEMRTFALVHIKDGVAQCELRQWVGEHLPHRRF